MKDVKYSVVMPTLNQSSKLKQCLFHLLEFSFDHDLFEVLVVDNGSTDDTKEISLSFKNKIKNLKYLFCESPGLMAARHMGCDMAKGEILCYIDDDSLVTRGWLEGISNSFSDESVVLVGGPCIPAYEIEPPKWIEYFWNKTELGRANGFLSLMDFGNQEQDISPYNVYGCNFSIRKSIFLELGGSCPDYLPREYRKYQGNGEGAVSAKLDRLGYKARYNPDVKINHLVPASRLTVDYFYWRAFFTGIGASFWEIRKEHELEPVEIIKGKNISLTRKLFRIIRGKLRYVEKKILSDEPKNIRRIRAKIEKNYEEGFAYHQNEVKKDPMLLEWVLRENYLGENGKLPE